MTNNLHLICTYILPENEINSLLSHDAAKQTPSTRMNSDVYGYSCQHVRSTAAKQGALCSLHHINCLHILQMEDSSHGDSFHLLQR